MVEVFWLRRLPAEAVAGSIQSLIIEKPKKKEVSFEDAVMKVHKEKETAEDRFREAFQREEGRLNIVSQKFEEALKRKDELEQPIRPIELD